MADLCLVVQPIHESGLSALRAAGLAPVLASAPTMAAVEREIGPAVAVVTRNAGLSAAAMARAPQLRVIGVHGVGTDAVAVEDASRRGIPVVNTPGANARSVAEHALALAFALSKALLPGDRAVRGGDHAWKYQARLGELAGRTLGVVGFGAIGAATARLGHALGMRVLVWARRAEPALLQAEGFAVAPSLDALLAASDVVSLHLALTDATRHLIGARELGLMKPHALLINTARSALVDEAALIEALRAGTIGGAGLDVFSTEPLPTDSPLCTLPSVVLSPHMAGSTAEALERTALMVAAGVVDVLAGRRPATLVNPAAWPA